MLCEMSYSQQRKRLEYLPRVLGGPKHKRGFFPSDGVILPRFGLTGRVVFFMKLNQTLNIEARILRVETTL